MDCVRFLTVSVLHTGEKNNCLAQNRWLLSLIWCCESPPRPWWMQSDTFLVRHHHNSSILGRLNPILLLFQTLSYKLPFLDCCVQAETFDLELWIRPEGEHREGLDTQHTVWCSAKHLHVAALRQEGPWTQLQAATRRLCLSQRNNIEKTWCLSQASQN